MESITISERRKSVITDAVLVTLFGAVPLFFLIKWLIEADEGRGFIIFLMIVALFFPMVVLAGYIWDVKQKIILSEAGVKLCYGRNIVDIMHSEGRFAIPPDHEIPWHTIAGFDIVSFERREPAEGGGYSTVTKSDLIIKLKDTDRIFLDFDQPKKKYYGVGLGKFKEQPHTILKMCEEFQRTL